MEIIEKVEEIQAICRRLKGECKAIGLIPTMGAFHEGHLSLIRASRKRDDVVVVSIFVNPIQFGPTEDYQDYPRNLEEDRKKASALGVDYLFIPSLEAIYTQGFCSYVLVEGLSNKLCGASRPGHFRGVTTVVAKLFHLIMPHRAYFGQKDAQQTLIIKRLIADLNWDIELVVLPIVREPDGLAMSSRNEYLKPQERLEATVLYRSLRWAEAEIGKGERRVDRLREGIVEMITNGSSGRIDYAALVDPETLEEMKWIQDRVLIALAVQFGRARLIDNRLVEV